jgi:hypothetical protein
VVHETIGANWPDQDNDRIWLFGVSWHSTLMCSNDFASASHKLETCIDRFFASSRNCILAYALSAVSLVPVVADLSSFLVSCIISIPTVCLRFLFRFLLLYRYVLFPFLPLYP